LWTAKIAVPCGVWQLYRAIFTGKVVQGINENDNIPSLRLGEFVPEFVDQYSVAAVIYPV
jgi:hypothetical protein